MNENRVVIVRMSPGVLARVFEGHAMSEMTSDWPDDAQIIDIQFDYNRWSSIVMKITSSTFDEVGEANLIPEWSPTFTVTRPDDVLAAMHGMIGKNAREMIEEMKA